jgi:hypothetical protein
MNPSRRGFLGGLIATALTPALKPLADLIAEPVVAGTIDTGFQPITISMVRRFYPELIAHRICGVQPMTGPTGLVFAMRAKYGNHSEA